MPEIELSLKQQLFDNYYSVLNEKQKEAVLSYGGPLLVIAGAGSGKTTVLVNRISHLIHYGNAYNSDKKVEVNDEELMLLRQLGKDKRLFPRSAYPPILKTFADNPCPPDRILAITFTNKAAGEIKERLERVIGPAARDIWAGTFHSICVRLLRMFADETSYGREFIIYDQDDCKKIITGILKELEIDNEEITPKYVMNTISKAKNALLSPAEFEEQNQGSEKRRICAKVFHSYQKQLTDADAMDFDDLILQTVILLRDNERVRSYCQNKFRFVLVDEYQDTNHAQYLLMKYIADGSRNVMVVGDDDQSIYKFRGAAVENILNFDKQYPDAKIILLEQNYRSTKSIITAANALISQNLSRRGKTLWSDNEIGRLPRVFQLENQEKEALFLVDEINRLTVGNDFQYKDIAILYRTRAQANVLETVFTKSGLPHRLLAGLRFYDHAEVKDMIAYLRFLHNKSDFVSFSRIINVPRRGIGQATVDKIREISAEQNLDFYEVIARANESPDLKRSSSKLSEFYNLIQSLTDFCEEHSPSEIVHEVIDRTGYMLTLLGDENEERRKNVDELISSATFFEEKNEEGSATLSGFLEEIALVTDVDNYDKNANSVVMMTVHAAKGLEFPIVFLVGMEENLFPSPQSSNTEEDLEEERRLAYVAMTRAKQQLFITCCHHRMIYGKTNSNDISRFIREIPEDYLKIKLYQPDAYRPRLEDQFGFKPSTVYKVNTFEKRPAPKPPQAGYKSPAASKPIVFSQGDRVSHGIFGLGTIISAKSYAADTLYEIEFDKGGRKKLMATYAKLKPAK